MVVAILRGKGLAPARRLRSGLREAAETREGLRDGLLELAFVPPTPLIILCQSLEAEQPWRSAPWYLPGDRFISASMRSSQTILKWSRASDQVMIVSRARLTASCDRQHSRFARCELSSSTSYVR